MRTKKECAWLIKIIKPPGVTREGPYQICYGSPLTTALLGYLQSGVGRTWVWRFVVEV